MLLFITKILVSIIVVFALVSISERNPRVGGLLVGLPLGTGIVVIFYAIEQNVEFVLNSVPYGIAGLGASLMFALSFYLGSIMSPFKHNNLYHTIFNTFCGLVGFFCTGKLISLIHLNLFTGLLVFLAIHTVVRYVLSKVEIVEVEPKKSRMNKVVLRIVVITFIILAITTVAGVVGEKWSGVLASFPIMLTPLIIILTYDYQNKIFPTVLRNFSLSIISLVLFYILLFFLLPVVGIAVGVIITYTVCFFYVYCLNRYTKRIYLNSVDIKKV